MLRRAPHSKIYIQLLSFEYTIMEVDLSLNSQNYFLFRKSSHFILLIHNFFLL